MPTTPSVLCESRMPTGPDSSARLFDMDSLPPGEAERRLNPPLTLAEEGSGHLGKPPGGKAAARRPSSRRDVRTVGA